MHTRLRTMAIAAGCIAIGATAARAQTRDSHIGLHLLYNTTYEDAGVGVQFSAPMAHHLEFYPSFDYYFQTPGTRWQANADVKYRVSGDRTDWLYVGTGLNISHFSVNDASSTRAGWNLLAGMESLRGQVHPFGEARVTVTDHTRFQLQGGINITLGRHSRR